jgi:hypothetical protein
MTRYGAVPQNPVAASAFGCSATGAASDHAAGPGIPQQCFKEGEPGAMRGSTQSIFATSSRPLPRNLVLFWQCVGRLEG